MPTCGMISGMPISLRRMVGTAPTRWSQTMRPITRMFPRTPLSK